MRREKRRLGGQRGGRGKGRRRALNGRHKEEKDIIMQREKGINEGRKKGEVGV